jgi:hypothetical protein
VEVTKPQYSGDSAARGGLDRSGTAANFAPAGSTGLNLSLLLRAIGRVIG